MTDFSRAPIGTAENPEIIEPGKPPRAGGKSARERLRHVAGILKWMITFTAPALFLASACFWLFDSAVQGGGLIPWLLLLLLALPTALCVLVAALANALLLLGLMAALFGRAGSGLPAGFAQVTWVRSGPRYKRP